MNYISSFWCVTNLELTCDLELRLFGLVFLLFNYIFLKFNIRFLFRFVWIVLSAITCHNITKCNYFCHIVFNYHLPKAIHSVLLWTLCCNNQSKRISCLMTLTKTWFYEICIYIIMMGHIFQDLLSCLIISLSYKHLCFYKRWYITIYVQLTIAIHHFLPRTPRNQFFKLIKIPFFKL